MRRKTPSKVISCLLAITHLVFSLVATVPGLAQAQSTDVDPPVIELEAVDEGVRGDTQVFSATVTDNNQVSSMTLHYRLGNDGAYTSVPMTAIQGTDIYTASVDTSESNASLIQYYMEAKDAGGNRTVQGFAFDPFERVLLDETSAVGGTTLAGAPAPVVVPRMSTQRKIAYGLLGLLAVGVLVGSSGGSSGGSSDPGTVDVSVVVDGFQ